MMMIFRVLSLHVTILSVGWFASLTALGQGGSAVVVYNRNVPGSGELADYYAKRRGVPSEQVFGLDLPRTETMTRDEYRSRLQEPLIKKLEESNLFFLKAGGGIAEAEESETQGSDVSDARIRYAVLCYGVPLKIVNDSSLSEKEIIGIPVELRRNEAAVDSELALLSVRESRKTLSGPFRNPAYGATNVLSLHPTNGVLMVARLDGPSLAIARGLVDKAIRAETAGLWGRAYFDARGLTNGTTKLGDDWLKGAALVTRRLGFETVLDDADERFSTSFPMSHIAFYAGWYEYNGQISGPFTQSQVEFVPGAFAYHLHSFSASTIRSDSKQWVGPLLAKGVSATMGAVYEPYLEFTPNLGMFFHRLIYMGFTFGEAVYACQGHLSWQMTVVGDPLYRPFALKPKDQHEELVAQRSKWLEWSLLKVVNINRETGVSESELIQFLEDALEVEKSSLLFEKLGDLLFAEAKFSDAAAAYRKALDQAESPQQRIRLFLILGRALDFSGEADEEFDLYAHFVEEFPNYPDLITVYKTLVDLSEKLKKSPEQERYQREVVRLSNLGAHSFFE